MAFYEETQSKKSLDIKIWAKMLPFFKPYRWLLLSIVLLMLGSAGIDVIFPLFQRYAVDRFIMEGSLSQLGFFIAFYAALVLIQTGIVIVFSRQAMSVEILSTPVTVPESGASSPIRMRSSVVFPQPERPISTAGPSTVHVKSCRTGVSPKRLQRFRITMLMPVPPRRGAFLPCAAAGLPPQTVPPTAARSPASMRTHPAWIA